MFNAEEERKQIVNWIRKWFEKSGPKAFAVIGISGGKDSTVAAALCVEAIGKNRVLGVLMPNGKQKDIEDSYRVIAALDIPHLEINIGPSVNAIKESIASKRIEFTNQANFNLPPRVRMTTLYAVSQCFGGRVVNTCNFSESVIGWETRWGDSVGDFSPLACLMKTEVVEIGKTFDNIPKDLILKAPGDGLCGKTDEDAFGFTYDQLDTYLGWGKVPKEVEVKIQDRIEKNRFKRSRIPFPPPDFREKALRV